MSDQNIDQSPSPIAASSADPSVRPDADIRARLAAHPWPVFGAALTEQLRSAAAARAAAEPTTLRQDHSPRSGSAKPAPWSRREFWSTSALALLLVALVGLAWQAGNARNAQPGPVPASPSATAALEGIGLLPEGAAVAWIDDSGIWYSERGQPRLLTSDGYLAPRISPDRKWVALQDVAGSIYLLPTSGGAARKILEAAQLPVTGPSLTADQAPSPGSTAQPYRRPMQITWSPDSAALVFSSIVIPSESPHGGEVDDLWAIDIADPTPRRLLPPGRATYFVVSPDSRHVAASGNGDGTSGNGPTVETIDLDGSAGRKLLQLGPVVGDGEPEAMSGWTYIVPQWTPDSSGLFVALPAAFFTGVRHATASQAELYRLPLDSEPVLLGSVTVEGGALNGVRWSPDGLHTAYVVAASETSAPISSGIEQGSGRMPAYPPPATGNSADLVVGNQDGSQGHVIATGSHIELDSWSPDGQLLLLRHELFDQPYRRFVPVTGGGPDNRSLVADTPVVRFVGPRDVIEITAAPNPLIAIDRMGTGGRELARTASGPMVEFDIVPAGGVFGGLPPATAEPVDGAPDTIAHVTPFPTRSVGRQPTIAPPDTSGTSSIMATNTPFATLGPEQEVDSFAFMPGTADVAFTVTGNLSGPRRALFVQHMDPTTLRLAPKAEQLAAVPSGFNNFYRLRAGLDGGPLFTSVQGNELDFDLVAVDARGTVGPLIAMGRYNPQDFAISPSGDRLAILTEDGRLLIRDVASGTERQVADGLFADSGAAGADFVFSPDGQRLAVGWQGPHAPAGFVIDLIDVVGRSNRLVSITTTDSSVGLIDHTFAAIGRSIYYLASTSSKVVELFSIGDHVGAEPRRLGPVNRLTGNDRSPSGLVALPDGKSILVLQDDAIYRIDPTAGTGVRVTPADEQVDVNDLQVTTALGHTWVAYRVRRLHSLQAGLQTETSTELRLKPLD